MSKKFFDIYSDYLISQGHYATVTGLSSLLNREIIHDYQRVEVINTLELS